jgi:hypothetical protein
MKTITITHQEINQKIGVYRDVTLPAGETTFNKSEMKSRWDFITDGKEGTYFSDEGETLFKANGIYFAIDEKGQFGPM